MIDKENWPNREWKETLEPGYKLVCISCYSWVDFDYDNPTFDVYEFLFHHAKCGPMNMAIWLPSSENSCQELGFECVDCEEKEICGHKVLLEARNEEIKS
jgi:hypothetical protein